jgi:WS/DGAT/MGAT family acyltransferase
MSEPFEHRMSDAEALMWTLEKDPAMRSSFLQVTFLDGAADYERFRTRIARAVQTIPRLRQRVVPPPARLAPPAWENDPSFDLDFHVRRIAVASPGTDRQLLDLAAVHYQDAFDRARPLWDFTLVEGLVGDRGALLAKLHHTITDGVGGVRLSAEFIDAEREPAGTDESVAPEPAAEPQAARPGGLDDLADALGHVLRRQLGLTRRSAEAILRTAVNPTRLVSLAGESTDALGSVVRQMLVTDRARSPLWAGKRSLGRRFEVLTVALDRLKDASNRLGGTLNDGFVTAMCGGIAAYHREFGVDLDELRMSMPVSTRTDRSVGGNAFSPTRVLLPVGIKSPAERLAAVHDRLERTKRERAIAFTALLAGVMNALPTALVVNFARRQVETVDFATSNVRAAPFDLFIAGAEILSNHPMGPTAGTALNATVMSYRNQLDVGINVDTAAVERPELLRDCISDAFNEVMAAGA